VAEDAAGRTRGRTTRGHRVRRITSTELAKRLSDVLNRVHDRGETVLVERAGKPICQITPIPEEPGLQLSELVDLLGSLEPPNWERT